jgi:hypothetical protein
MRDDLTSRPAEDALTPPDTPADAEADAAPRAGGGDSFFGYLLALALAIGLTPLIPVNADLRYALSWGLLALFGVAAWLLGGTMRIEQEAIEDLVWGVVFGLMLGAPLLLVGGDALTTTARLLFTVGVPGDQLVLPPGAMLALIIFTQPLAETLFFRGVVQARRSLWVSGAMSSGWALVLFLPMMEVGRYPVVAFIISIVLVLVNVMYAYVRQRNGLAAAWVCQIVVNIVIIALPYFGR